MIITEKQAWRFNAIASSNGWQKLWIKRLLDEYGYKSSLEIEREHYEDLCNIVSKFAERKYRDVEGQVHLI